MKPKIDLHTMLARIKSSGPRLLPFIGALLLASGVIGLTLISRTGQEVSFDSRKDASVANGPVLVRARVIDPKDQNLVTVVIEGNTNNNPIDGYQLDFSVHTAVTDQITMTTTTDAKLQTVRKNIKKSHDNIFVADTLVVTSRPSRQYSSNSYEPIATLTFKPIRGGSFDIVFNRQRSIVTRHALAKPQDILRHIESISFEVPDPKAELIKPKICRKTGCSGHVCADRDIITTCEWKEEYGCYRDAKCEVQTNGECGFTQDEKLLQCLKSKIKPSPTPTSVPVPTPTPSPTPTSVPVPPLSACPQSPEFRVDGLSCAGVKQAYVDLKWRRASSDKMFEVWLSQDPNYQYIFKKIITRHSEWQPNYTLSDGKWYAKVRVYENESQCSTPGQWTHLSFEIRCSSGSTTTIKKCNEICTTNSECAVNHLCHTTAEGRRCRLAHNPESTDCSTRISFADNSRQCNTSCYKDSECVGNLVCWHNTCRASGNLLSPVCTQAGVGGRTGNQCNEACATNLDCDANLICYRNACRLVHNPTSAICAPRSDDDQEKELQQTTVKVDIKSQTTKGETDSQDQETETAKGEDSKSKTTDDEKEAEKKDEEDNLATKSAVIIQRESTQSALTTPPPTSPETQSNEKGFLAWLKRLFGISSTTRTTTPNDTQDSTKNNNDSEKSNDTDEDADNEENSGTQAGVDNNNNNNNNNNNDNNNNSNNNNSPSLAITLLVIGLVIILLTVLISIIRSILNLGRPRGVVKVSQSSNNQRYPASYTSPTSTENQSYSTQPSTQSSTQPTTQASTQTSAQRRLNQAQAINQTTGSSALIYSADQSQDEQNNNQESLSQASVPQQGVSASELIASRKNMRAQDQNQESSMMSRMKQRNIKTPK